MVARVLALHGFGTNAELFGQKLKALLRKLKSIASVVVIDAPFVLPYDESLRGWWLYNQELWDGTAETIQSLADVLLQRATFEPVGLDESLAFVMEEWSKGYDAVLGFSQGAVVAAALCAKLQRNGCPPRFAILISGFGKPIPQGLQGAFEEPIAVPSLHIWGEADAHMPPWTSQLLADRFHEPRVHVHPGGHFVPQKAADLNFIAAFLQEMQPAMAVGAPSERGDRVASADAEEASAAAARSVGGFEELRQALRRYLAPSVALNMDGNGKTERWTGYEAAELEAPGPGTYERLLALLKGMEFLSMQHGPCRTSEDAVQVRLAGGWKDVTLHSGAKAMLLRTPKSEWLLSVLPADCKLSWKKLRAIYGKGTRIATEEEVIEVTGCLPGAVPPIAAFPKEVMVVADATLPEVLQLQGPPSGPFSFESVVFASACVHSMS
ncbi:unnamed protein product [Durusdinium trenchii]|uniref:Serine hydrolase FSH domain-containing protein n=1 Tax=Durusdinium trenchii TaxID=1381693 RepID=A0ABP0PHZ4_9DINO